MTKRRKLILAAAAAVLILVVAAVVVVHRADLQRRVWLSVTGAIEESSGIRIEAADVRLRVYPARLVIDRLRVDIEGQTVLTVEEVRADWKWRRLAAQPRRIEKIVIRGPEVFGDALPSPGESTDDTPPVDVWSVLEIGSLEITGGRASAGLADVATVLEGVAMRAGLVDGVADAAIDADRLVVSRSGRDLVFSPMSLQVEASAAGVEVRSLEVGGDAASLSTTGQLRSVPGMAGRFEAEIEADLAMVAEWWDPNLVTGLAPEGRARLVGELAMEADGGITVELAHRAAPIGLAGYDFEVLELTYGGGQPTVRVEGAGWGRAEVSRGVDGMTSVSAALENAPVDRILAFAAPQIADAVRGPTTLSGRLDGTFAFPIDPATLAGDVDLVAVWPEGRIAVRGAGVGGEWSISRAEAQLAGVTAAGSGAVGANGRVQAEVEMLVADPGRTLEEVKPWVSDIAHLAIGGGPIEGTLRLDGSVDEPRVAVNLTWSQPAAAGHRIEKIGFSGNGGRDVFDWVTKVEVGSGSTLDVRGTAHPLENRVEGDWSLAITDLGRLVEYLPPDVATALHGSLEGTGSLEWTESGYRLDGRMEGREVGTDLITVPRIRAAFAVDPAAVAVEDVEVEIFGGVIEGRIQAPLTDFDAQLDAQLSWRGLDLAGLPVTVPEFSTGLVSGRADVGGTVSRPTGDVEVVWEAKEPHPVAERLQLRFNLADGILRARVDEPSTRAGSVAARAEIPLGDLERPPWLWPDAPGGPVTGHLNAEGFRLGPVAEMLAVDTFGSDVVGDLEADVEWSRLAPDHTRLNASVFGLRLTHPTGELVADGPVVLRIDGRKVHIEPVALVGFDSRIEVEASYDPETESIDSRLSAVVNEDLARLLQLPISVRGPFNVVGELHLPVAEDIALESVTGTFTLDHGDGALVMRDPPVELRQLKVTARVQDGRVDIVDGSAEVNRGTVLLGGGWDPKSGQGIVFEVDDVTLFFEGVLTKWTGDLVVEPRPDVLAHVAGDLTLVAGLWDETFDLTSAVLGAGDVELAADDPLHDISLDLSVRGRSGVKVDNNLGRFDVAWDVLRIDGTAAAPRIHGAVRIAPGGVIALGGREIKVRRGTLDFTGDPAIDPIVEIVPENDMMLVGGEDGTAGIDPTLIATRGLAQGISSVLGFENETLRPAEIAVQIERDPSVNFMVGQRINRNLALFLSANLTDVQDRMTMLQGWNFRGVRGLVAQIYQETVDDNAGVNLLQRFSWGGTSSSLARPEIYRLKLEGEWPSSKKRLKKATRLRRGQPYDPFLLFVASVRMERALAENGYQSARVTAFQEGDDRAPTLVFYCDPGIPQIVRFEGDALPKHVRAEVTSMYEPPPLEGASLDAMDGLVTRYQALQGFPDAKVVVERQDDVIVVVVDRGAETKLAGPFFDGLPDDVATALAAQIGTASVVAAMIRRPEALTRAVERHLALFGYLSAKVRSVEIVHPDPSSAEVRIDVEAGPRQTIDEVVLLGEDPLGLVGTEKFSVRAGQPLDRETVDLATRNLRNAYIQAGYREASARSEFSSGDDGRWVVQVGLEPGRQRRLRNVEYAGVKHASEGVLDKGLVVAEGEILTDAALDRSASRIANFAPIERVEVRTRDVGTSEVDVDFEVVEKARWAAEVGGGWSTERGLSTSFGIRDDNLFGRGLGLNLRGGWGSTEQKLFLIGSLPPVPGGRLSLITNLGYQSGDSPIESDILNQDELLASMEALYAATARAQVGVYYRWTKTETYDKVPNPFEPPFYRSVKIGTFGARTIFDSFDNLFDPRRGYGFTSDLGWSSNAFGSDFDYISWLSNFSVALEPYSGATWLQTLRVGVAEPLGGQNLPPEAKFFAGGQASIRGFDLDSVGPLDFGVSGTLVPAGGGALFILNEELRIPVWGALRFAVFADIGQVWESWRDADLELAVGAGVGVRWSTPIGPLWADVAWPVANVGISSKRMKFYLGIGRPF